MKFGVIKELVGEHPVRKLCRVLGVARSASYAAQQKPVRPRARENLHLEGKAREVFEASGRTYGSPRVEIVGWAADETMPTGLVTRACERAVAAERPGPGLLHHSDRGSQYASDAYRELLRRHGVIPSMSRSGNCYDNAKTESFWATLKTELIDSQVYATRAEAKSAIFQYIEVFYNRTRLHGALGFYSPVDFENSLS